MRPILLKTVWLAALCVGFFQLRVQAIDYTWDNWSGDSSFNTEINWNPYPGGPPDLGDTAIFATIGDNGSDPITVDDGTAVSVLKIWNADVDMQINGQMSVSATSGLYVGESYGQMGALNIVGGTLGTLNAQVGGRATLNVTSTAEWNSASVLVSGDTGNPATINLTDRGRIATLGTIDVGSNTGEGLVVVDGTTYGLGLPAEWQILGSVDVGPDATSGFNRGQLILQNNGRIAVTNNVAVHGTSEVASSATVRWDGELAVANNLNIGPFGEVHLEGAGSRITTGSFSSSGGTFNWTGGTLEINNSGLVLDSAVPHSVFGSSLTVGQDQKLIHSNPAVYYLADTLAIGFLNGWGDLTIEEGGLVESVRGIIGGAGTSSGHATVRDNDSSWTISDQLRVGNQGSAQGTLQVQSGGQVAANCVTIGQAENADGTIYVDGFTSTLTSNTTLSVAGDHVGAGGTGGLFVRFGGTVEVVDTLRVWPDGQVAIIDGRIHTGSFLNDQGGTFSHGGGVLTVDGGAFAPVVDGADYVINGAMFEIDDVHPSIVVLDHGATTTVEPRELRVGNDRSGWLVIQDGSTMTVAGNVYLAYYPDPFAHGTLDILGEDSQLTVLGDLEVGDGLGGNLNISNGGVVDSSGVGSWGRDVIGDDPGSVGTAHVAGWNARWETDTLIVGDDGNGGMHLHEGGVVNSTAAQIAALPGSTGDVTIVDNGSQWNIRNTLEVGGHGATTGGTATLTIGPGGLVEVADAGAGLGLVKVFNGSAIYVMEDAKLDADTLERVPGSALLTEPGSVVQVNRLVGFGPNPEFLGQLTIGTSNGPNYGVVTVGGGESLTAETILVGGDTIFSQLILNSGGAVVVTHPVGMILSPAGRLSGEGIVVASMVDNGGVVAPGGPVGLLSITGDYMQQPADTALLIELGGIMTYDRLAVDETATLAGNLIVSLVDNFVPGLGDSFDILTAGTGISGKFAPGPLPFPAANLAMFADYGLHALTLKVGLLGDVNGDGAVNGLDVAPFVAAVVHGPYDPRADMDQDYQLTGLDVDPFVSAIVGGGAVVVAEPATVTLAAFGLIGLLACGRRRLTIHGLRVMARPEEGAAQHASSELVA